LGANSSTSTNMYKYKLKFIFILFLFIACSKDDDVNNMEPPPQAVDIDLEAFTKNFRGFNLQGKFDVNWSNTGFSEEHFIIMQDLGFNFARLPLDYNTYTKYGDWDTFIDEGVMEIDQAIEWGKKYGVHICLNLHRAPGYSVNTSEIPSNHRLDLWTNTDAQEAFVNHWGYFSERYKDEDYRDLSFNLVNEPANVDEAKYVSVMKKAIDKIHSINPNRVVFVDALEWAREPMRPINGTNNIIQAIHVYEPFTLTHYKASWVNGSNSWPVPVWPMVDISNYLFGPEKPEFQSPLVLKGNFTAGSEITVNVHQVSIRSRLTIKLDGELIYEKNFVTGPDKGDDWTEIILTQWGYQNISRKDYSVTLPSDGSELVIENSFGDWMTYNSLTIKSNNDTISLIPGNTAWGEKQGTYIVTNTGNLTAENGDPILLLGTLTDVIEEARQAGIPLMIQEFGVHNQTPHSVSIRYLSDVVSVFNENELGFALWNLNGSFGIIDSGRDDCDYESYRGHQLDRALLDVLKGR
jgi:aryl-phospho-beta-D-glucosidase BglC (GH1 family)